MAALIFLVSDSATQYIMHRHYHHHHKENHDDKEDTTDSAFHWHASRAVSGSLFGVVATTWLHYWWGLLERVVGSPRFFPLTTYRFTNTMVKVVVDQAIGAPLYIYTYYLLTKGAPDVWSALWWQQQQQQQQQSSTSSRESVQDMDQVWQQLVHVHAPTAAARLGPTLWQHYHLWPLVHTLNFYFVPLHHRVLVQNTVLVGWSGYLSHLNYDQTTTVKKNDTTSRLIRRSTTVSLKTRPTTLSTRIITTTTSSSSSEAAGLQQPQTSPSTRRTSQPMLPTPASSAATVVVTTSTNTAQ